LVRIRTDIINIVIHSDDKVVFLLRRFIEEDLLSDCYLLGCGVLDLIRRI
jgi:hypothetical protein